MRFNRTIVRGSGIRVCRVRFGKGGTKIDAEEKGIWSEKSPQANQANFNHRGNEVLATVKGEMNEFFMEWLSKSVIGVSEERGIWMIYLKP